MTAPALLHHYAAADEPTRIAGRRWYTSAEREAIELSRLASRGVGRVACAGILAALSPRAQWSVNVRWAHAIVLDPDARVSTTNCRAKARAITLGWPPATILRGLKVCAFWRAIAGEPDAAVIDVWMLRAMGIDTPSVSPRQYAACASALREAAVQAEETTRDFQAIVWMQIRGVKPTDPTGYRPAVA